MPSRVLPTAQILTMLAAAPAHIATLTADLAAEQLQAAPAPGEWSANGVLAHLRSCADIWGDCMRTMLAQERPTLRAVNPTTWIEQTNYREVPFPLSLQAFTSQRAELLTVLTPLLPEAWSRSATVTGAGKPLERTVHFYAQWLARHERPHLKQIQSLVKKSG